jgi:predicted histone-like DNA-binding protein
MSIKYSLSRQRNPQDPEAPRKFYARVQVRETIDLRRLAKEIAYASSLTPGDVLNVLMEMGNHVASHLADGDLVDLGDFGRLQYQVSGRGADTEEEFKYTHISKARLQFRPGYAFRAQQALLQYEKVFPLKAPAGQNPEQPAGE